MEELGIEFLAQAPSKLDTSLSPNKPLAEELVCVVLYLGTNDVDPDFWKQGSRMDLIAFDSPFVTDPPEANSEIDAENGLDFESLWNSVKDGEARGWYEASTDIVVRRMQSFGALRLRVISGEVLPFIGATAPSLLR